MARALQLARAGRGHVSPNPMVGAVIVSADGRIIGEGWHRRFGQPNAEVNAVASVADADRHLLRSATIYVTLEPCSHYGKTPPCAKLLIECGIRRVVIASGDPNPKVSGRGIAMLRQAGIEVAQGLMADEAVALNRTFMNAHTLRRPFVTLKWAQSADGFMDHDRADTGAPARFSTQLSSQLVHFRRACHDAIAVGAGTAIADRPRLDVRLIKGRSPRRVLFDRNNLLNDSGFDIHITDDEPLDHTLRRLYSDHGITSLLVEGGPSLLSGFIDSGLWDEAWVEVSGTRLADRGRKPAPVIHAIPDACEKAGSATILFYTRTTPPSPTRI